MQRSQVKEGKSMSNSPAKAHSVSASEENRGRIFRRALGLLIQYNFIVIFFVLVIHAARLSGVPARRVITLAFMISGALAGLSGVLLTSRLRIGQPTAAQGLELDAIAAVVLAGTSLFGGRGGVVGTFVAVMLLQVLRNLFNLLGLGSFYQMTVTSLIIVLAILLDKLIDSRSGGRRPNPSRSMPLNDC
jgi:ribose/xylose/arabinose/galactoside ABC-type transport system permease subunit